MKQTFTYIHLKLGLVQHEIEELEEFRIDHGTAVIRFKDRKNGALRTVIISTNQPYHLRSEESQGQTDIPLMDPEPAE